MQLYPRRLSTEFAVSLAFFDCVEFDFIFSKILAFTVSQGRKKRVKLTELVPILQIAVGPVILISGVGLLLLSMTNRLGRVIDRSRLLAEARRKADEKDQRRITSQLDILSRRARLVRLTIILATLSVLLAALLVIVLFLAAALRVELGAIVMGLFAGCMGALIGSLVVFILDINLSLAALKLEISD